MKIFVRSSVKPTPPLTTKSPVNTNTRRIVVRVATILQEIAFIMLLTCVSVCEHPLEFLYSHTEQI